jgi:hypothetical protein
MRARSDSGKTLPIQGLLVRSFQIPDLLLDVDQFTLKLLPRSVEGFDLRFAILNSQVALVQFALCPLHFLVGLFLLLIGAADCCLEGRLLLLKLSDSSLRGHRLGEGVVCVCGNL